MKKTEKRVIWYALIAIATASAASAAYITFIIATLPDPSLLGSNRVAESTKIYDRTGTILLYELYKEEKRTILPISEIPDIVKQATIALEDKDFYAHSAIDWKSLVRATLANIMNRGVVQGGSTITQQLAKNAFLSPDRTISRKIKELFLANRLERNYSKEEILGLYINQIPYGANAYGIEAASQTYFGKPAKNLTMAEAALLVSLPKAPSYYSPWGTHVDELLSRKDRTLEQMAGVGFITEKEENDARKERLEFVPQSSGIKAPHFVMMVQEYLARVYGEDIMRTGGLKIITTLDWGLQQAAEKAVKDGAARNEKLYKGTNAALAAEDPRTGQLLALVGSRDYFDKNIDGNFNVAAQGLRQPGSSIKPFTYYEAFRRGFAPETVLFDVETEFDTTGDPERSYKPHNFDDIFRGPITMRNALAQSINIPAVKTLYLAGIDNVIKAAHAMGITTLNERNRYGLSLTLGGGEVKLVDMVAAYSTLAADGVHHKQSAILEIRDALGKIIEKYEDDGNQAADRQAVRIVNDVLSDTSARAPLFENSLGLTMFPDQEIALKTGTTNDYRDAWTFGYTPSLVAGIWAGNNDNAPMQKKGGSILAAVPIWNAFMKEALKERKFESFPRPDPIIAEHQIMNGQYEINGEIHSILYHISRKDPQDPPPENPETDSQFLNWESAIAAWIEKNPQSGAIGIGNADQPIEITIESPQNGAFATSPLSLQITMKSAEKITGVEIYLNDRLVDTLSPEPSTSITYQPTINANLNPQNKLSVRAKTDVKESRSEIIIFSQ